MLFLPSCDIIFFSFFFFFFFSSQEVNSALSTGDYSSIHDFYQRTFSSPIELNALMKRNVDADTSFPMQLNDSNINTELLYAVYDHLDDLVSGKNGK